MTAAQDLACAREVIRWNFRSRTTPCPKRSTDGMRQVAHFCVTLRHSCGRKNPEIDAFRQLFGSKSVIESPKWRKSLPAQRLEPSLQMLQKCSIVAHSVHSAAARKFARAGDKFADIPEIRPLVPNVRPAAACWLVTFRKIGNPLKSPNSMVPVIIEKRPRRTRARFRPENTRISAFPELRRNLAHAHLVGTSGRWSRPICQLTCPFLAYVPMSWYPYDHGSSGRTPSPPASFPDLPPKDHVMSNPRSRDA